MARAYTKVLGKRGILEQMKAGAYIYRVPGKFGGWGISDTTSPHLVTVRADSCRALVASGLLKETRSTNFVRYDLKEEV